MLFCMLYAFGALGVFCFGGLVNTDPQRGEYERLQASSFGEADYYPNNFNDLASGFVTCFELLIVNNWMVLCEGYVAACQTGWARAFFVAFYAESVLIILNVAVAFCVEAFLTYMGDAAENAKERTGAEPKKGGDVIDHLTRDGTAAVIDAAELTGTRTGLTGVWRATTEKYRSHSVLEYLIGPPSGEDARAESDSVSSGGTAGWGVRRVA